MEVSIATSVKYGRYKIYRQRATLFSRLINEHENKIRTVINLPANIQIIIRPIPQLLQGNACVDRSGKLCSYTVEIDIRQTLNEFCDTLLHELVHIEQFYEERLILNREQCYSIFEGKRIYTLSSKDVNYHKLPWEQEATNRAKTLTNIIFNETILADLL